MIDVLNHSTTGDVMTFEFETGTKRSARICRPLTGDAYLEQIGPLSADQKGAVERYTLMVIVSPL